MGEIPLVLKFLRGSFIAAEGARLGITHADKSLTDVEKKFPKIMEPHLAQFFIRVFSPSLLRHRHLVPFKASLRDPFEQFLSNFWAIFGFVVALVEIAKCHFGKF